MDIYVKKAIIHQFSPDDTDLYLADKLLNITPKIEEYLRKKIERVYSDEARTGIFEEDNPFLEMISDDLLETSVAVAKNLSSLRIKRPMIWCSFNSQKKGWTILPFFGLPYGKP